MINNIILIIISNSDCLPVAIVVALYLPALSIDLSLSLRVVQPSFPFDSCSSCASLLLVVVVESVVAPELDSH